MLNLFFVMFYAGVKPHIEFKKLLIESFNEYMILLISIQMICFTNFVENILLQFYIGYAFVTSICFVFLINLLFMIQTNFYKFRLKLKQKKF